MTNQEMCEKILNKKFTTSTFAGYKTDEVDAFFDMVIDYLKRNDADVLEFKQAAENLKIENTKLKNQLVAEEDKNKKLSAQIQQFIDDGYGNVIHNKLQDEIDKKGEK